MKIISYHHPSDPAATPLRQSQDLPHHPAMLGNFRHPPESSWGFQSCFHLKDEDCGKPRFSIYISGWWFEPLWKIWVRQLGWLWPQYMGKWLKCKKWQPNHQPDLDQSHLSFGRFLKASGSMNLCSNASIADIWRWHGIMNASPMVAVCNANCRFRHPSFSQLKLWGMGGMGVVKALVLEHCSHHASTSCQTRLQN